jgi:hypothetical protein
VFKRSEEPEWLKLNTNQLLQLRGQLESMREDYNDRIWETVKFFTTIFSGLSALSLFLQYVPEIAKSHFMVKMGY